MPGRSVFLVEGSSSMKRMTAEILRRRKNTVEDRFLPQDLWYGAGGEHTFDSPPQLYGLVADYDYVILDRKTFATDSDSSRLPSYVQGLVDSGYNGVIIVTTCSEPKTTSELGDLVSHVRVREKPELVDDDYIERMNRAA